MDITKIPWALLFLSALYIVPQGGTSLSHSALGYKTKEVTITGELSLSCMLPSWKHFARFTVGDNTDVGVWQWDGGDNILFIGNLIS